jgi:two-component system OmpR family response regulator
VKVLVVEDNPKVARFLARLLSDEGFVVDVCDDGTQAIRQAKTGIYELVVLDWMLPGKDGVAVCLELRKAGCRVPVLMLTARGELRERVLGLDAGADDYLVKPFEVEEFVARVRALLRRSHANRRVSVGDLELDIESRRVLVAGAPADLTAREFAVMLHLAESVDKIVTRGELLQRVWNIQFDPGSNVVEVQMRRLREKLGAAAWMIETVRGAGYRLRTTAPASS